jgi:hypothetical protein
MSKISIDLLTVTGDYSAFSPVIWDGNNVVIAESSQFNLKALTDDLNTLVVKLTRDLTELNQRSSSVSDLVAAITAQVSLKDALTDSITKLSSSLYPSITALSTQSVRHSIVESTVYDQQRRTTELSELTTLVRSGQFLKAVGKDIEIPTSSSGSYQVAGRQSTGELLISENNVIDIQYTPDTNTYMIAGAVPDVSALTVAGKGIKLVVDSSKYVTVSLKDDLIVGNYGLNAENSNGVYTLNFASDFITAASGGGLQIQQNASGTFSVDFTQDVKDQIYRKYYDGYGISITGKTIAAEANVRPTFVAGNAVRIYKVSTNPDTYSIQFYADESGLPRTPQVTATSPINVTSYTQGNEPIHVVSLDKGFNDNIIAKLSALEVAALDSSNRSQHLFVDDFSDDWKKSFFCPIMRLFSFITGDYEGSGLVRSNADPTDIKLLKLFGAKTVTINMHENMLPYVAYSEIGSGTIMGVENDINLFIPLENKLRELLGDPTFVIPASQKGTKYKIVRVGTSELTYHTKDRSQLPEMFYNMEFALSALNGWATGSWPGTLGVGGCSSTPIPWNSTKYANMPLMVTGGDCDFIAGVARAGQTNSTKLTMPSGLVPDAKITIAAVSEVDEATTITYTLKIHDGYTNADYACKFKRLVGSSNIQPNVDYITELEGKNNPGHVRAYARLYTNWKLPDTDLNRILYFLGANKCCMATFGGAMIYKGTVEHKVWAADYLRTVGYTQNIGLNVLFPPEKINYSTGDAKLSINLTSGSVGYSQFPIDLMLKDLKFPITYQFTLNADAVYDITQLFDPCCWGDGFVPKDKLVCGIDDATGSVKLPYDPAPELSFGHVAERLREAGSTNSSSS